MAPKDKGKGKGPMTGPSSGSFMEPIALADIPAASAAAMRNIRDPFAVALLTQNLAERMRKYEEDGTFRSPELKPPHKLNENDASEEGEETDAHNMTLEEILADEIQNGSDLPKIPGKKMVPRSPVVDAAHNPLVRHPYRPTALEFVTEAEPDWHKDDDDGCFAEDLLDVPEPLSPSAPSSPSQERLVQSPSKASIRSETTFKGRIKNSFCSPRSKLNFGNSADDVTLTRHGSLYLNPNTHINSEEQVNYLNDTDSETASETSTIKPQPTGTQGPSALSKLKLAFDASSGTRSSLTFSLDSPFPFLKYDVSGDNVQRREAHDYVYETLSLEWARAVKADRLKVREAVSGKTSRTASIFTRKKRSGVGLSASADYTSDEPDRSTNVYSSIPSYTQPTRSYLTVGQDTATSRQPFGPSTFDESSTAKTTAGSFHPAASGSSSNPAFTSLPSMPELPELPGRNFESTAKLTTPDATPLSLDIAQRALRVARRVLYTMNSQLPADFVEKALVEEDLRRQNLKMYDELQHKLTVFNAKHIERVLTGAEKRAKRRQLEEAMSREGLLAVGSDGDDENEKTKRDKGKGKEKVNESKATVAPATQPEGSNMKARSKKARARAEKEAKERRIAEEQSAAYKTEVEILTKQMKALQEKLKRQDKVDKIKWDVISATRWTEWAEQKLAEATTFDVIRREEERRERVRQEMEELALWQSTQTELLGMDERIKSLANLRDEAERQIREEQAKNTRAEAERRVKSFTRQQRERIVNTLDYLEEIEEESVLDEM